MFPTIVALCKTNKQHDMTTIAGIQSANPHSQLRFITENSFMRGEAYNSRSIAHIWRRTMTTLTFRPKIILVLLLVTLLTTGLSIFFFTELDAIVHGDLYRYGLEFNYDWAGQYWNNSRLILGLLDVTMLLTGISLALTLLQARTPETHTASRVNSLFLIIGMAAIIASMFFFTRLDAIVHGDLYRYGLEFDYDWAGQYWNYSRLIFEVLAVAIGISGFSAMLISLSTPATETPLLLSQVKSPKRTLTKPICYLLTSAGAIALASSIYFNSSILAFIGLGLILWGIILFYIKPEKYIKETLLDTTTLPSLANLNHIIEEIDLKGKAVYLPPRHFKTFESTKVYISAQQGTVLPPPEKTQEAENEMFLNNPNATLMTPPGLELKRLFEKRLDTVFTRVNLQYLEQNLPKLLVEDLEIAQEVEMETRNNMVLVKTRNSIYRNMCKEAQQLPKIHASLGCPLCSALASALAEATGKPVLIEQEQTGENGETTDTKYHLLETTEA
jgi:hypothetical protein